MYRPVGISSDKIQPELESCRRIGCLLRLGESRYRGRGHHPDSGIAAPGWSSEMGGGGAEAGHLVLCIYGINTDQQCPPLPTTKKSVHLITPQYKLGNPRPNRSSPPPNSAPVPPKSPHRSFPLLLPPLSLSISHPPAPMGKYGDIEAGPSGGTLYPYMIESPQLRWAFIRKVYTIVLLQLLLTVAVAAAVNFYRPIPDFFRSRSTASFIALVVILVVQILILLPLMYFRERHPVNLVFLVLFTLCMSFTVGLACAYTSGWVVLEAAVLTTTVVVGLTLYTFWGAKRGQDFSFLGPFLFAALLVLMLYGLMQIFLPLGKMSRTIYGCLSALIFSGFIIYDTDNLIKHHTYDQYVAAAISLYLDVINLFMAMLTIFDS